MPSSAQRRISGPACTESFQRYGSSTPTLKSPAIGFWSPTAPDSLAPGPESRGAVLRVRAPEVPGRSEPAPGRVVHGQEVRARGALQAGRAIRNETRAGANRADRGVPHLPELAQPLPPPKDVVAPRRIVYAGHR